MRACFLGQNICALGFGVATLQTPPLVMDEPDGQAARTNMSASTPPGGPEQIRHGLYSRTAAGPYVRHVTDGRLSEPERARKTGAGQSAAGTADLVPPCAARHEYRYWAL